MTPHPSGHPAGTGRLPARTPTGERIITGSTIRAARAWTAARVDVLADVLADWTCAERVLAVVGALVAGVGSIDTEDLDRALREPETVDCALDLLAELGVGCA